MGFYYGAERFRKATANFGPVLTPHEYTSTFALARQEIVGGVPPYCESSDRPDGLPRRRCDVFVQAFIGRVRRSPNDPTAHRLLGAALLDAGSARAGVRHLGIALRLLLAGADRRPSLHSSLCARFEIALVLIPLIPVAARSGRPALVRRIISLLP